MQRSMSFYIYSPHVSPHSAKTLPDTDTGLRSEFRKFLATFRLELTHTVQPRKDTTITAL